jgi:tape measure domain-containing protein
MSGVELEFQSNAKSTERDLEALNRQLRSIFSTANTSKTIFPDLTPTLNKNTKSLKTFSKEADSAGKGIDRMFGRITNSIQALGLLGPALDALTTPLKAFKGYGDGVLNLNSKLRLATESTEEFLKAQGDVKDIAKDTKSSLGDIGSSYAGLSLVLKDKGFNGDALTKLTSSITKAAKLGGGPIDSINAALFQLRQGLGADALRGEELNSIIEQTPYLANILRKGLGMTTAEMRKAAASGELTAAAVADAITSMTAQIDKDFNTLAVTSEVGAKRFEGAMSNMLGELNVALGISENSGKFLLKLADKIEASTPAMIVAITNLKDRLRSKFNEFKFEIPLLLKISKDFVFDKLQRVAGALDVNIDFDVSIDALKNLFEKLSITAKNGLSRSLTYVNDFSVKVRRAFFEIYDEVVGHSWWPDTIDGIVEKTSDLDKVVTKVKSFAGNITSKFADIFKSVRLPSLAEFGDSVRAAISNIDLSSTMKKFSDNLIVSLVAAFAIGSESALFSGIGVLLTAGLLEGPLKTFSSTFGTSLATEIGNASEDVGKAVAKGLVDGISVGFSVLPDFTKGFVEDLVPLPEVLTKTFLAITPLGNQVVSTLIAASAALAVFSSDFRKFATTALFGSKSRGGKAAEEGLISLLGISSDLPSRLFPTSLQKKTAAIGATILSTAMLDSVDLVSTLLPATPFLLHAFIGGDAGAKLFRTVNTLGITLAKKLTVSILNTIGLEGLTSKLFDKVSTTATTNRAINFFSKLKDLSKNTFANFEANSDKWLDGSMSLTDSLKSPKVNDVMLSKGFADFDISALKDKLSMQFESIKTAAKAAFGSLMMSLKAVMGSVWNITKAFGRMITPASFGTTLLLFSQFASAADSTDDAIGRLTKQLASFATAIFAVSGAFAVATRYYREFAKVEGFMVGLSAARKLLVADFTKMSQVINDWNSSITGSLSKDAFGKLGKKLITSLKGLSLNVKGIIGGLVVAPLLLNALFGSKEEIKAKAAEIYDSIRGVLSLQPITQEGRAAALKSGSVGLNMNGSDALFAKRIDNKALESLTDSEFLRLRNSLENIYGDLEQLERAKLEQGYLTEEQLKQQNKLMETTNRLLGARSNLTENRLNVTTPADPNYGSRLESLFGTFDNFNKRLLGSSFVLDENTQKYRRVNGILGDFADWWTSEGFLSTNFRESAKTLMSTLEDVGKKWLDAVEYLSDIPDKLVKLGRQRALKQAGSFDKGFGTAILQNNTAAEIDAVNLQNEVNSLFDKVGGSLSKDQQVKVADLIKAHTESLAAFQAVSKDSWGSDSSKDIQEVYDRLKVSTDSLKDVAINLLRRGEQEKNSVDLFKKYMETRQLSSGSLGIELPEKVLDSNIRDMFSEYLPVLKALKLREDLINVKPSTPSTIRAITQEKALLASNKEVIKSAIETLKLQFENPDNLNSRIEKLQSTPDAVFPKAYSDVLKQMPVAATRETVEAVERLMATVLKDKTFKSLDTLFSQLDATKRDLRTELASQLEKAQTDKLFNPDMPRTRSYEVLSKRDAKEYSNIANAQRDPVIRAAQLQKEIADLDNAMSLATSIQEGSNNANQEIVNAQELLTSKLKSLSSSPALRSEALQSVSMKTSAQLEKFINNDTLNEIVTGILLTNQQLESAVKMPNADISGFQESLETLGKRFADIRDEALVAAASSGQLGTVLDSLGETYTKDDLLNPEKFFRKRGLTVAASNGSDAERLSALQARGLADSTFTPSIDSRRLDAASFSEYMSVGAELNRADLALNDALATNNESLIKNASDTKKYYEERLASIERSITEGSFDVSSALLDNLNITDLSIDTNLLTTFLKKQQALVSLKESLQNRPFNISDYMGLKAAEKDVNKLKSTIERLGLDKGSLAGNISNSVPGLSANVLSKYKKADLVSMASSPVLSKLLSSTEPDILAAFDYQNVEKQTARYEEALRATFVDAFRTLDATALVEKLNSELFAGASEVSIPDLESFVVDLETIKAQLRDGIISNATGNSKQSKLFRNKFGNGVGLGKDAELFNKGAVYSISQISESTRNLISDTENARLSAVLDGLKESSNRARGTMIPAAKNIAQNDYDMLAAAWEDGLRQASQSIGRLSMEAGFRFRDTVFSSFREGLSGLMKGDATLKDTFKLVMDRFTGGIIDGFVDGFVSALEKTDLSGLLTRLGKGQFDLGTIFGGSEFANQQTAGATLQTAGISLNTAAMSLQAAAGMMSGQNGLGMLGDVSGMFGQSSSFDKAIETAVTPSFESVTNGFDNVLSTADMGFKGVTDSATETFGANGPLPGLFEGAFGSTGFLGDIIGGLGTLLSKGATGISEGIGSVAKIVGSLFMADGGHVSGRGTSKSDSIPAMLSNGEFVVNAAATAKNRALLEAINKGRVPKFADGGIVKSSSAVSKEFSNRSSNNSSSSVTKIDLGITGDISRQTRAEVMKMLPELAQGVNMFNKERNVKRR